MVEVELFLTVLYQTATNNFTVVFIMDKSAGYFLDELFDCLVYNISENSVKCHHEY